MVPSPGISRKVTWMSGIPISRRQTCTSGRFASEWRIPASTLALTLATFAVGADVFAITGSLPSMDAALHVPYAEGEQSLTVFAVVYVILAPVVTITTARVPRRARLVIALLVLGIANVGTALAPNLPV